MRGVGASEQRILEKILRALRALRDSVVKKSPVFPYSRRTEVVAAGAVSRVVRRT